MQGGPSPFEHRAVRRSSSRQCIGETSEERRLDSSSAGRGPAAEELVGALESLGRGEGELVVARICRRAWMGARGDPGRRRAAEAQGGAPAVSELWKLRGGARGRSSLQSARAAAVRALGQGGGWRWPEADGRPGWRLREGTAGTCDGAEGHRRWGKEVGLDGAAGEEGGTARSGGGWWHRADGFGIGWVFFLSVRLGIRR